MSDEAGNSFGLNEIAKGEVDVTARGLARGLRANAARQQFMYLADSCIGRVVLLSRIIWRGGKRLALGIANEMRSRDGRLELD